MDVVLGSLRAMYPSLGQDDIERSLARVQRIVKAAQAACVGTDEQPASVSDWRAKVVADFTAERGAPLFLPSSPPPPPQASLLAPPRSSAAACALTPLRRGRRGRAPIVGEPPGRGPALALS
jgi:hypothetical protein